jgi:fluoride ion exporter CrcB/FEX
VLINALFNGFFMIWDEENGRSSHDLNSFLIMLNGGLTGYETISTLHKQIDVE